MFPWANDKWAKQGDIHIRNKYPLKHFNIHLAPYLLGYTWCFFKNTVFFIRAMVHLMN